MCFRVCSPMRPVRLRYLQDRQQKLKKRSQSQYSISPPKFKTQSLVLLTSSFSQQKWHIKLWSGVHQGQCTWKNLDTSVFSFQFGVNNFVEMSTATAKKFQFPMFQNQNDGNQLTNFLTRTAFTHAAFSTVRFLLQQAPECVSLPKLMMAIQKLSEWHHWKVGQC